MARKKESSTNAKSNKKIFKLSIAIILVIVCAVVSYIYFTVQKFNDSIFPGVQVEEVNLSGATKDEAMKILREKYSDAMLNKKINIKAKDKNYFINYPDLKAKYNIDDTVNHAMSYGKDKNMFSKYMLIKGKKGKVYELELSYDVKPIDKMIDKIAKETNVKPVDAKLSFDGGSFGVKEDKKGVELEKEKLKKEIISNINDKHQDVVVINAPFKVIASKVTAEVLKSVNSKLGSYSTNYATSSEARLLMLPLLQEVLMEK